MVSLRIELHRLPKRLKDFVNQGVLTETHMIKIAAMLIDSCFSPWLTAEQAMVELAEKAVYGEKCV